MTKSNPITINGHAFPSQAAAAKYYKLDQSLFSHRLRKYGPNSPKLTLPTKKTKRKKRRRVMVAGKMYKSYYQAAIIHDISYATLTSRLKRLGPRDPKVLSKNNEYDARAHAVDILGKHYHSLTEAAADLKMTTVTLRHRLQKYGYNNPEITKTRDVTPKPVTIMGKTFPFMNAAARYYKLDSDTLRHRLKKYGPNDPRVIAPSRVHQMTSYRNLVVDGHHFNSIKEAAHYYGLPTSTVLRRIRTKNADPTDPRTYQPKKNNCRQGRKITYRGTEYPTLKAMHEQTGISLNRIQYALQHDKDINALEPSTRKK